ncbi:PREDICTED: uncharacterized protein LOC109234213 [Nicotiana attenuata]|uniref:uncharacterized protein LOC109234213 n=1 Tax=Nicotiana attenuata TaxID=49451 RepID=UPI0009051BD2|nr:PREDICTED: uncharacterized protein LOC109234213 [Nicotiana attenuata]
MEIELPHQSYKEMLLDKQECNQANYYDMEHQSILEGIKGKHIEGVIPLSPEEKERLYKPWKFSVIIKVFKRRMPHHMLRSKLIDLWKPSEQLILIDLGWDFYIVKFSLEESTVKALHLGPWFVSGHFLSVRKWEPKFVPQEATLTTTAIWIRLPQLPTEFYDTVILEKVGRKLVETSVIIGDHKQSVIYEGEGTLCTSCGRIGHTTLRCSYSQRPTLTANESQEHHTTDTPPEESQWKTVTCPRRRKQGQHKTIPNTEGQSLKQHHNTQAEEVQNSAHLARVTMEALNKALTAFGPLLWQSMANNDSPAPITDPQALNNHILQSFHALPFFPDLMKEDPAAEPIFTQIIIPPNHTTSNPKKETSSPPLQNIHRGVTTALEILKKKDATEELEQNYPAPRIDSIMLDSVRSIDFSTQVSEVVVVLCPRAMSKCGMSLVSAQTQGPPKPLLNLTPILSLKRKSPPPQLPSLPGPSSPQEGSNLAPTSLMMNYIIWNVMG